VGLGIGSSEDGGGPAVTGTGEGLVGVGARSLIDGIYLPFAAATAFAPSATAFAFASSIFA